MEVLNVTQGSEDWLKLRLEHFTASECASVMGESKFMSRNQLLDLKKEWQSNPDGKFMERLYQKGHDQEDAARAIFEMDSMEEFPPITGKRNVSGLELLASFDGLSGEDGKYTPWEHKGWNSTLAENVRNSVLEPLYYWQLEHQMLVADCKDVVFMCSDGTSENMVKMIYKSVPERRKDLIAGWKQFAKDLKNHELVAKVEKVVGNDDEKLPVVAYSLAGTEIISNITDVLAVVKERAETEMSRVLETDQDFADKDNLNKAVKKAREDLKAMVSRAQGEFVSFAEFSEVAKEMDGVLQKMQASGEKQVKQAKDAKKDLISDGGESNILKAEKSFNKAVEPLVLGLMLEARPSRPDFDAAMKGKRTIESLQNAVDVEVAQYKIKLNDLMVAVLANLKSIREIGSEHKFLFRDLNDLASKDNESFVAIVKNRIAEHEDAEKKRLDEEREKIRIEEEVKAKKKIDDEAAAVERGRIAKEAAERREEMTGMDKGSAEYAQAETKRIQEQSNDEWIEENKNLELEKEFSENTQRAMTHKKSDNVGFDEWAKGSLNGVTGSFSLNTVRSAFCAGYERGKVHVSGDLV